MKTKIQREKMKLKDIQQENDIYYKDIEEKKNKIIENVQKVEQECNLSINRYMLAKKDYESKEKEYIEKFKQYQNLLDPSLLLKVKTDDYNTKELNESKIKFKMSNKKLSVKYNSNINNTTNNMTYKTTTLTTGNNGKNFIEEKKVSKFEKKK